MRDHTTGETPPATFTIESAEIIQRGQITIEKAARESHGLAVGDYVDVRVYHEDSVVFIPDLRVGESGRVTIPSRQRDRYDIAVGDPVSVACYVG